MKTPEQAIASARQATSLCHSCPKLCRFSCPVAEADQNESTTPWGKMSTMKLVDRGILPFNTTTAAIAYKCLNCRASEEVCEMDNPVAESLNHYRAKAFAAKLSPPAVYRYSEKFQQFSNPFGRDLSHELMQLYPRERGKIRKVAYFAGCTEIRYFPETIGQTLNFFRRAGIDLGFYQEEIPCCGYPLHAAGDTTNFRELAEINSHALKNYREIWSGTPSCLYTMETLYRELGFSFATKFFHVAEKIPPSRSYSTNSSSLLRSGAKPQLAPFSKWGKSLRIAYHDPCYLGRYRGIYDEPRRLIAQITGKAPVEFFRNRENSYCCGAGGLLPVTSPESAKKITENRLEEFYRTGASLLVSACPTCLHRFKEIDPKVEVKSLMDLIG